MMKLAAILLLFAQPQDTLTLQAINEEVLANWPTAVRSELSRTIAELEKDNLGGRYLPGLSLRGHAAYHSSVVTFPFEVPNLTTPGIPHDQYTAALDLDQLIYDGGEVATQKRLAEIGGNLAVLQTDVELHQVRDHVNRLFFDALTLQAQIDLTRTLVDDTRSRLDLVRAGIDNGAALQSDADILEAELINVTEDLRAIQIRKSGYLAALSQLAGREIPRGVIFKPPDFDSFELPAPAEGRRPELDLFDERARQLEELADLTDATQLPKISGFGQAGIGRPPDQDFFTTDFAPYFVLGLRLNWKFWDWSQSSRQRQIRMIEQEVLMSEEDAFSRQITVEAEIQLAEIVRLDSAIASDARIIELRDRIAKDAGFKLENGTITATDYLIERNQAHRARLQQSIHTIQRAAARVRYATTIGANL